MQFLDVGGNWIVQESCRWRLPLVSNSCMAAAHKRAVALRQKPTESISLLTITAMKDSAKVRALGRVLRLDECTLNTEQYMRSLLYGSYVTVIKDTMRFHGLVGKP